MSAKSSECWAIDPQARGLRIEIEPGHYLTLPFNQLVLSEFTTSDKGQQLRFVFATHEILIHGKSLRRVDIALQHLELGFIAKASSDARAVEDGAPTIREIVVKEIKPDKP